MAVDPIDPTSRVRRWLASAKRAGDRLPEAMALATSATDGTPAVRYVLLEECDARGFAFSCSQSSRKAAEIAANRRVAIALYWHRAGRQVRVEGVVEDATLADTDRWWNRYSRKAKLATRAEERCERTASRSLLARALREEKQRLARSRVPRPDSWRSYRILPSAIELWEQRPTQLHYRERFERRRGGWRAVVLVP